MEVVVTVALGDAVRVSVLVRVSEGVRLNV